MVEFPFKSNDWLLDHKTYFTFWGTQGHIMVPELLGYVSFYLVILSPHLLFSLCGHCGGRITLLSLESVWSLVMFVHNFSVTHWKLVNDQEQVRLQQCVELSKGMFFITLKLNQVSNDRNTTTCLNSLIVFAFTNNLTFIDCCFIFQQQYSDLLPSRILRKDFLLRPKQTALASWRSICLGLGPLKDQTRWRQMSREMLHLLRTGSIFNAWRPFKAPF